MVLGWLAKRKPQTLSSETQTSFKPGFKKYLEITFTTKTTINISKQSIMNLKKYKTMYKIPKLVKRTKMELGSLAQSEVDCSECSQ